MLAYQFQVLAEIVATVSETKEAVTGISGGDRLLLRLTEELLGR